MVPSLGASATGLAINRSPDGATWGNAVAALEERAGGQGVAFDKNWLACDNTPS